MITVAEALSQVLAHVRPLPPVLTPLAEASGRILGESVASDMDSPPYDKALVDGFAVRAEELQGGEGELEVVECVLAGQVPAHPVQSGQAIQIMTGAPLPPGADAVVMVERCTWLAQTPLPARIRVQDAPVRCGQNVLRQGTVMREREPILEAGKLLRPAEIGLLAEVGRSAVIAHPRPNVAIISTGDELVPPEVRPRPGQIRNSNGPMLAALTADAGGQAVPLGIGKDTREALHTLVSDGLQQHVLLLSGGVSAGLADLVPEVLQGLGVDQIFHKVHMRPGKPLWFGLKRSLAGDCLVFGLPGNPVSSLVGFELFVRPALARLSGRRGDGLAARQFPLLEPFQQRGERPTYFPTALVDLDGRRWSRPLAWQGSADLRTLSLADGLACFPPGDRRYESGDMIEVLCFSCPS